MAPSAAPSPGPAGRVLSCGVLDCHVCERPAHNHRPRAGPRAGTSLHAQHSGIRQPHECVASAGEYSDGPQVWFNLSRCHLEILNNFILELVRSVGHGACVRAEETLTLSVSPVSCSPSHTYDWRCLMSSIPVHPPCLELSETQNGHKGSHLLAVEFRISRSEKKKQFS